MNKPWEHLPCLMDYHHIMIRYEEKYKDDQAAWHIRAYNGWKSVNDYMRYTK